jgi:hypothetical protein
MDQISMELAKTHKEEVLIWKLCYVVSQRKKTHLGKFKKK